jgi:predicted RNA binding protein YcfA (HicA-like mRNA interferase family)
MGESLYPQVRKLLIAHGCFFVRQGKGSHEIWASPINNARFPVPVTIVSRNTANGIFRQAGIKEKF